MSSSHQVTVMSCRGGRKYEYRCSCGAKGWQVDSSYQAQRQGEDHKAKKERG
ncbi:hypothetical protein [Streptomyces glomeratus]|uniref:Mobile element transfer n=1 Tax=Streptomyces glomeratus TaxID=284452 RepID=A0ABP6LE47_9ACTN|nr:hypothetical protein [Streptomyces glomeratus]MCF1507040.1 hypothetical protein [Streptomyces glomeratus]